MSTMVSARVPSEIYDQGLARLADINASTSDLIVSAFAYVAKTGQIPAAPEDKTRARDITATQLNDLKAKISASSLKIALPDDWDYREELTYGMEEDCETLD